MSHPSSNFFSDDIAREIIEQSPAIAIRVTGERGNWDTAFITKNIIQYGYDWRDFQCGQIRWGDIIHPDDLESLCASIDENDQLGIDRYSTIYRIITAWGQSVWVNDISTVMRDKAGKVLYSDCIISDYTKLKESNDKIADNARQQDVLNDILVSLHSADLDQAFNIILDRTGKYLGISRILLFEDTPDHAGCKAVYEWCNQGISSMMAQGPFVLDYEKDIPEIDADLTQKGMRAVDFGQIPSNSTEEFDHEGVIAAAIFAVYRFGERYGFICFDECLIERKWSESTLTFLQTISKLVSTAVMRRKNDEAVHTSQVTMETVLNNIPTYIFVIHPTSREIVFANQAYRRDFPLDTPPGISPETLHQEIGKFCETCLDYKKDGPYHTSHYFEVELPISAKWFGVQCRSIPWITGENLRLFSCQDITEKKEHEEYIRRIAYMDHLTGLPNRYRCDVDLQAAIDEARQTGRKGYVLFIDMDDFKIVNDGYGHDYGDALLIEFAQFVNSLKMGKNCVFRFGGDEFVILVDPSNADYIHSIIKTLVDRARRPWPVLDKSFYCTLSVGIVAFPDGGMGIKEILKNADIAMYEAKKLGKNSYTFYSDNMRNDSIERAEMEAMLRECIANGFAGFETFFQPYVDLRTERITGAEALIRWFRPDGRLIMPVSFISLSEYLGLIIPIGMFVLREACLLLKIINESGHPDFTVSVNISIRQLQQQDIIHQIEAVLSETKVNPRNLILEITEGLEVTGLQRIQILLGELHKKGIQIAMDDFGTGYSSLSNMRDMPIDIIKIDRSFIQNITKDQYSHSFIKLIADFSRSVGKQICIEGVETEEQLTYCRDAGAYMIQGYYFYRPMPKKALMDVVEAGQIWM